MFVLDQRLADDTYLIGRFDLSLLLLSKDANYPWCILVPEREDVLELYHLSDADQQQLTRESCQLAEVMNSLFDADKINIAALGNVVSQLHVHHVARFVTDQAWPAPVWGAVAAKAYDAELLQKRVGKLTDALAGKGFMPLSSSEPYQPRKSNIPKINC
ncbi:HIT domain-containing protein [Gilvimarinus polysaccharolyticus]|uniref:HIT domain-containing protein n=1 Tax=Gilvimarinus polysaccharolyticus TaxID=863921 RepID=UPI0006732BCA|nr:HIT domain-containing protein [Gilvimarinus polysaccharolyticus]